MRAPADTDLGELLAQGPANERVSQFRDRVRGLVETDLSPLVDPAERNRHFPRTAVSAFGASGLFHERWSGGQHGDLGRSVIIAEELGFAALGGVGVGVSLHFEVCTGILRRFGSSELTRTMAEQALAGTVVCCLATSERDAGSNLDAVATTMRREGTGWRIHGTKWFVSPGAEADLVLVLCRAPDGLAIVVVPRSGVTMLRRLPTTGMRGLGTVRLAVDAVVADEAILVRPGFGLPAATWGLVHERLAIAAQILGSLDLAVRLAVTRAHRRHQFGRPLIEHQALRLRLAELSTRVGLARHGLYAMVTERSSSGAIGMREVAGLKVFVARLAEHVVGECMHLFGGEGYLEDDTPLPRLWRDLRIGRLGGGGDEVMLELVAAGLTADDDLYARWVR